MWWRKRMLEELDEDIREHIEREAQDNIERGMISEEAMYAAMRKFGNVMRVKEDTREVWSFIWLDHLLADIRFGLRMLRKNPGFTAVAALTLALGMGANTAVFSVVYAVLLRPLPYKDPSHLVVLNETTPRVGTVSVSYPNFLDWRDQSHTFSQMTAVHSVSFNLAGVTQPEHIDGEAVSPSFLSMMGANEDPIGKRFLFGHPSATSPPKWCTIVGVVSDTKLYGLANPARLEVYVPFRQDVASDMTLAVKAATDPATLTSAIREVVHSIDKDQPLLAISTMKELVSNSVATRRMTLILLGLFSGMALILGAIGIYGVISYSVAQRTHEIGIRVALGAPRRRVFGLVVGEGLKLAGIGVAIGIAAAFVLARLMSSLLYGVSTTDLGTFAGVAALLTIVALVACYVLARRAMQVDPMAALRHE